MRVTCNRVPGRYPRPMKNKIATLFVLALVSFFVGACTGENMAPNYNRCNHMQCGPVDGGVDAGCVDEFSPDLDGGLVNG
jgi:hypothetical protein